MIENELSQMRTDVSPSLLVSDGDKPALGRKQADMKTRFTENSKHATYRQKNCFTLQKTLKQANIVDTT